MELEWLGHLGVAVGILLPVAILLALVFQFRMNRRRPRPWPEGMEPPEEGFEPVQGELVDRQSLSDVIFEAGRIRINEKLVKRRSEIPWLVPFRFPSKPGKLWLGKTGLVFYYKHRDGFYQVAYADITGVDTFQGWYRGCDFRTCPALIVHHEIGEDRIAVFELAPGITERFARLLGERVSREKSECTSNPQEATR
jgi:hypothetical protein